MKLKHLTISFLLFVILAYVVFMVIQSDLTTETEKAKKANLQPLFYKLFLDMTHYGYGNGYGLDYDMDIPKAILKLENLIAQGANSNKKVNFGDDGEYGYSYTPISYIFRTCENDDYIDDADDRNFYLDIVKLLIDSGVDWNAKDSYQVYESEYENNSGTSTIADRLKRTEENSTKPECLEALDYVKNHLKENNIILE